MQENKTKSEIEEYENDLKEKYMKEFNLVQDKSYIRTYKVVRKEIEEYYINKYKVSSNDELQLELDRLNTNIENLKSPLMSIVFALIIMIFTLAMPEFVNNIANIISVIFESNNIFLYLYPSLKIIIYVVIGIIIILVYSNQISKKERKLLCLLISKDVIENLKHNDGKKTFIFSSFEEKAVSHNNLMEKSIGGSNIINSNNKSFESIMDKVLGKIEGIIKKHKTATLVVTGLLILFFMILYSKGIIGMEAVSISILAILMLIIVFLSSYETKNKLIGYFGIIMVLFLIANIIQDNKISVSNRDVITYSLTIILVLLDSIKEKNKDNRITNFQRFRLILFSFFMVGILAFSYLNDKKIITIWASFAYLVYFIPLIFIDESKKEYKIENNNTKFKLEYLIGAVFSCIVIIPILIVNDESLKELVKKFFHTKEIAIVYLQYFGALIGGLATLGAVLITTRQAKEHQEQNLIETRKIQEENKKNQYELLNLQETNKIKTNAFIIENDLKICFRDIFRVLVRYSITNSNVGLDEEERVKWIKSWKDILRQFEYSSKWREELKVLSNSINIDELTKIYEIYTLLDQTKHCLGSIINSEMNYKELYRNIELLPKEEIFKEDFVKKYRKINDSIDRYNNFSKKLEENIYEIETKELKKKMNVLNIEIVSSVEFFDKIDKFEEHSGRSKYHIYLKDEWEAIFVELDKISKNTE